MTAVSRLLWGGRYLRAEEWSRAYESIIDVIVRDLDFPRGCCRILELGAGRGQLTVPLAKRVPRLCRIYTLDSYQGPYRGDYRILKRVLHSEKLTSKVTPLAGDIRDLSGFGDESFDMIVSNELFCELKRAELKRASKEFFRLLRLKGCMAHGDLSPVPEHPSQRLLVDMDSSSKWSASPSRGGWFSPTSDEVASMFHEAGFSEVRTVYVEMNIHYTAEEAKRQLSIWGARRKFLKVFSGVLETHGIDIPMEYIVFCRKR